MTRSAADPSHLRHLLASGRSAEVPPLADRTLRGDDVSPEVHADLLLLRLAALINLGRRGAYLGALDEATAAVRACPDPELYGRLYTLAALIANLDGAIERGATYLVQSSRALRQVHRVDRIVACAWHDLAMAYSYAGLHGYALSAIERARRMAATAELPEAEFLVPAIRVRLAVWHDHHGDTDACVRVLRDVVADLAWHERVHPEGLAGIRPGSLGAYGYAAARLAALGQPAPLPTLGHFDLIIASDVLYERGHAALLAGLIGRHALPEAEVVLSDPGRGHGAAFTRALATQGFELSHAARGANDPGCRLLGYRRAAVGAIT